MPKIKILPRNRKGPPYLGAKGGRGCPMPREYDLQIFSQKLSKYPKGLYFLGKVWYTICMESLIDKSKFRNASGTNYLNALFFEETGADKSSVVYTLKDDDHLGYPSLYKLYMDVADPTEYKFAIQHLDGWQHWEKLLKCSWFDPFVSRWRRELELRMRSWALAKIIKTADTGGKEAFPAARYLLEGNWKPAGASKAGRPTKAAILKEAHQQALEWQETGTDYKRLIKEAN